MRSIIGPTDHRSPTGFEGEAGHRPSDIIVLIADGRVPSCEVMPTKRSPLFSRRLASMPMHITTSAFMVTDIIRKTGLTRTSLAETWISRAINDNGSYRSPANPHVPQVETQALAGSNPDHARNDRGLTPHCRDGRSWLVAEGVDVAPIGGVLSGPHTVNRRGWRKRMRRSLSLPGRPE